MEKLFFEVGWVNFGVHFHLGLFLCGGRYVWLSCFVVYIRETSLFWEYIKVHPIALLAGS